MFAIHNNGFGAPDVFEKITLPRPTPQAHQLLVRVKAVGLNRADVLQRKGFYPPPEGESAILGLELSGEVVECGAKVSHFKTGDLIFGLVGSGAYAEYALVHESLAFILPPSLSLIEAAAIPEAFFTAHETVFELGQLQANQTLLLYAAGSGIGTTALQMACLRGCKVIAVAGDDEKLKRLNEMGVIATINYKKEDVLARVLECTDAMGVDVIEDFIGGEQVNKNLQALKFAGRLVQVAHMNGRQAEIDLSLLQRRCLQLKGFVLRSRSLEEKQMMASHFREHWLPELEKGAIQPIIDRVFDFEEVRDAHRYLEENKNFGKVVLTWE